MAADQNTPVAQHPVFGDLSRNWGWLLAFGILSVFVALAARRAVQLAR